MFYISILFILLLSTAVSLFLFWYSNYLKTFTLTNRAKFIIMVTSVTFACILEFSAIYVFVKVTDQYTKGLK